jgi:hypothetical protein
MFTIAGGILLAFAALYVLALMLGVLGSVFSEIGAGISSVRDWFKARLD